MNKLFLLFLILVMFSACHKDTAVETPHTKITYVYNVVKERNSNPLNIYYFYISESVDTANAKDFRVDLDSNNIATFTLPDGVKALQKIKDSVTVEIKSNNLFGATIIPSAANKGVIDKITQATYVNGRQPQNSDFERDSFYTYTFKLTEYKKGALMRVINYGMYLHRLK